VSEILRERSVQSVSRMAELQGIGRQVKIFALS